LSSVFIQELTYVIYSVINVAYDILYHHGYTNA